jgi:hypothetical protein
MLISRPAGDDLAARVSGAALSAQSQIQVQQGDCCVVSLNGQILGRVDPGVWQLQQFPFAAHLLSDPNGHKEFLFVLTRPYGPVKIALPLAQMGLRPEGGSSMLVAEANIAVHDPLAFSQNLVGSGDPNGGVAWIQQSITKAIKDAVSSSRLPVDQLGAQMGAISQSVAGAVASSLGQLGITFRELTKLGQPGGTAAAISGAPTDGRLLLLGKIAGKMATDSPDPKVAKWERFGFFVAADASAMRDFSGAVPGWRWIGRGAGDLMDQVGGWPKAPDGSTSYNFSSEEQARAYYGALRQHAFASVPGLQAQDTRQSSNLNVPSAYSETLWLNGQEVFYLIYDRIEDMQALAMETDEIGIHAASPPRPNAPTPPIVTYKSESDVHYVAVARGPNGAADHVLIVLSDEHAPVPTITDGLPRAEWMSKFEGAGVQFPSNVLVVQWGRFAGTDVLAQEDPQNPAASLAAKIGGNIGVPLQVSHEATARMGGVPAAYAIRMEPGSYSVHYYELHTDQHGSFSCCAISRDGAESFMPVTVGNAGGMKFGGLGVEQYAMLSVERDNLLAQMGPQAVNSQEMAAICQRYGIPFSGGGMAGRINEWEQYIQGDPAFSAQWATQRSMATMKLQGHQPSEANVAALAQHQQAVQGQLQQHANQLDAIRDAAIQLIVHGAGRTPQDLMMMVQQHFSQFKPEDLFYKALRILRDPDEFGRFDTVQAVVEPLARCHYHVMSPDDQRFNGSADKYFKEEREAIFSSYGIEVPAGFFGKLFG